MGRVCAGLVGLESPHKELAQRGPLQEVLDSERFTLLRSLDFFAGFGDVELWEVVHRAKWQRHTYGAGAVPQGRRGQHLPHRHPAARWRCIAMASKAAQPRRRQHSVGEMAYLAPNPELRVHTVDILVSQPGHHAWPSRPRRWKSFRCRHPPPLRQGLHRRAGAAPACTAHEAHGAPAAASCNALPMSWRLSTHRAPAGVYRIAGRCRELCWNQRRHPANAFQRKRSPP